MDDNFPEDFDLALVEEVYKNVYASEECSKSEAVESQFLGDILNKETDIVLGKRKPDVKKKGKRLKDKSHNEDDSHKDSIIHKGDTDSSDDEDNKYFEERKYNDYGKTIKGMLENSTANVTSFFPKNTPKPTKKWTESKTSSQKSTSEDQTSKEKKPLPQKFGTPKSDVLLDPVLNMHIIKPLVSSSVLREKMIGRTAVPTLKIKNFIAVNNLKETDWVTGGVIVSKFTRTSQKGNQYCVWNITDLLGDIKMVCVFLFGSAYQEFWKTALGMVVGILNPNVMEANKENKVEATLSVDNAQKIMIFGTSKDYGICKSKKKNGENCTAVVNTSRCDHCVYHVKQAYNSASRRSDLQSSFTGKGLNNLRNKVLGKNEVFYGGKTFTAIPNKTNTKRNQKDEQRLKMLSEKNPKMVKSVTSKKIEEKDVEILKKLAGVPTEDNVERDNELLKIPVTPPGVKTTPDNGSRSQITQTPSSSSKITAIVNSRSQITKTPSSSSKITATVTTVGNPVTTGSQITPTPASSSKITSTPVSRSQITPTQPSSGKMIDLDTPISKSAKSAAKLNALKFIRQNGPLKKLDPNAKKKMKSPEQITALKRRLEAEEKEAKKPKLSEEREESPKTGKELMKEKLEKRGITDEFLKMMNSKSRNSALLQEVEAQERDKKFEKLEIREKMEEKMASTFKIECKAVRCLKCNYKSFSASDLCKSEKHPLKVINAVKRFWKCGDCGARTVCLELVPLYSCKVCGSSRWEKSSMMPEKKDPNLAREPLSIRGHEEKFVGAAVQNANLNLLVPDET